MVDICAFAVVGTDVGAGESVGFSACAVVSYETAPGVAVLAVAVAAVSLFVSVDHEVVVVPVAFSIVVPSAAVAV